MPIRPGKFYKFNDAKPLRCSGDLLRSIRAFGLSHNADPTWQMNGLQIQ